MDKNHVEKLATATADDIYENPESFGLPKFEDFAKNPEKYLGRDDEKLGEVDRGSEMLNRHVKRHVYEFEGYRCKSLEEVERVAGNQGLKLRELEYTSEVVPLSGGWCDIKVNFMSKSNFEKRKKWA